MVTERFNQGKIVKMQGQVVFASYGGKDVTQHITRTMYQVQGNINIPPGQYAALNGGDPFPMTYKDFVIVTRDNFSNPDALRVSIAEDNEHLQVNVNGPHQSKNRTGERQPAAEAIVQANYGGLDVTTQVQQMFNSNPAGFQMTNPNLTFGDPLPNVVKALVIIYRCTKNGPVGTFPAHEAAYWNEGEQIYVAKVGGQQGYPPQRARITIAGGVNSGRRYLSTTQDGTNVDLWTQDDNSGRQKWGFEPVGDGSYRITIAGGVNSGRRYLSTAPDGTNVDLWIEDDNSGRQKWRLESLEGY